MRFNTLKGFVSVLFLLLILASTDVIAVQRAKTQSKRRTALELVKKQRSLRVLIRTRLVIIYAQKVAKEGGKYDGLGKCL